MAQVTGVQVGAHRDPRHGGKVTCLGGAHRQLDAGQVLYGANQHDPAGFQVQWLGAAAGPLGLDHIDLLELALLAKMACAIAEGLEELGHEDSPDGAGPHASAGPGTPVPGR